MELAEVTGNSSVAVVHERMNCRRERHSKLDLNFAHRLKRGIFGSYGKDKLIWKTSKMHLR